MMTTGIDIKKPHFISEVRNFRYCDRVNEATYQVLYPLGNNTTNMVKVFQNTNNSLKIRIYSALYQGFRFKEMQRLGELKDPNSLEILQKGPEKNDVQ